MNKNLIRATKTIFTSLGRRVGGRLQKLAACERQTLPAAPLNALPLRLSELLLPGSRTARAGRVISGEAHEGSVGRGWRRLYCPRARKHVRTL